MQSDFKIRKRIILGTVIFLVTADLALAVYSWELRSRPRTPEQELLYQARQLKLVQADIDRAKKIQADTPKDQKDCDDFERSLFPASTGYSSVAAEIGQTARKSGLRLDGFGFRQKEVPNRGLTMVEMEATVTGEYSGIVRFLNGVQRSQSMYEIHGLSLAGDSQSQLQGAGGLLRVALRMKTYFRTGV